MTGNRKPWWKRKRSIAAAVLWVVVSYPLSFGPAMYAWYAGWISVGWIETVYRPMLYAELYSPHAGQVANDYVEWWYGFYVQNNPERFASSRNASSDSPAASYPLDPSGEETTIGPHPSH